jgi:signal transduction histidine kinase
LRLVVPAVFSIDEASGGDVMGASSTAPAGRYEPRGGSVDAEPRLPRLTGFLQPAVDAVARVRSSIHRKLLFGFLAGAVLLIAMAVLSLVVIDRMDERMDDLSRHEVKVTRAQQMLYAVTAQSHYRAMALLLVRSDPEGSATYDAKIGVAKQRFARLLSLMERDDSSDAATYRALHKANATYAASSRLVEARYRAGDIPGAIRLHIAREHKLSHVLEDDLLSKLIDRSTTQMADARAGFADARRLLTAVVIAFSAVSVVTALMLGFLLSWAIILPVKKIDRAFARVTVGDFDERVSVPNRDELGRLAQSVNTTSLRLAQLFETQRRLASRLTETNDSLQRASEAKSRFLASVSHELRTPMNAILGFTDALLAGLDGPLNAEQRASLEWVQRGGRDLLDLINEILDLSKVEAGKLTLDPRPLAPAEAVGAVVGQLEPLADEKGLRLAYDASAAPQEAVLDEQRLRQIVGNLVGNALKFAEHGEVRVVIAADGDLLDVAVHDNGPGIRAEDQEAIFDEFRQGDNGAAGTGLGLAISRRLARAMGGDVTVESTLGSGSVFHLVLPLDCRAGVAEAAQPEEASVPATERLVLSIDDDPSVAPLLQKMLGPMGYQVIAARSASSALEDARRLAPHAVLLDLLMPDRDGSDVLAELKRDPATSDIPVIVVSVVDPADVPEEADGHVAKPVDKDALLAALVRRAAPAAVV